jgi:NAD(P)H-dependent flavin oxidoreductase YrpB (nitropropane dioxygenase family)
MSDLARRLDVPFPLFAFSHCRDVVAAVSRAGGFGVLGIVNFEPDQLERELAWIDAHVDGRPYGVDILMPEMIAHDYSDQQLDEMRAEVPDEHVAFVSTLMASRGLDGAPGGDPRNLLGMPGASLQRRTALAMLDVVFRHPVRMIVNALGVPPREVFDGAHPRGILIGALAGSADHARRHAAAGVDVIVAQGGEGGGHCGEVSTLVLIPEVVRAMRDFGDIPVLAAGGIVTGRQMAACVAMGAAGAWTGSVWLATPESEVSNTFREKMVAARSRDTVRSKGRTGKYSRQLRSAWTDAWDSPGSPKPLPMPLQSIVTENALAIVHREADKNVAGARELATYWVGQGVGLIDQVRPAARVVQDFREDFAEALGAIDSFVATLDAQDRP